MQTSFEAVVAMALEASFLKGTHSWSNASFDDGSQMLGSTQDMQAQVVFMKARGKRSTA